MVLSKLSVYFRIKELHLRHKQLVHKHDVVKRLKTNSAKRSFVLFSLIYEKLCKMSNFPAFSKVCISPK